VPTNPVLALLNTNSQAVLGPQFDEPYYLTELSRGAYSILLEMSCTNRKSIVEPGSTSKKETVDRQPTIFLPHSLSEPVEIYVIQPSDDFKHEKPDFAFSTHISVWICMLHFLQPALWSPLICKRLRQSVLGLSIIQEAGA